MTMGQRIRRARTEAGLSQRELAGDEITRNMLSALEHDAANPSVHTLRYLADRLGKPVSYFLDEELDAIALYHAVPPRDCLRRLEAAPDGTAQWALVCGQCLLDLAQEAVAAGRLPEARILLKRGEGVILSDELVEELLSERFYLLCAACPESESQLPALAERLPSGDPGLLLRARGALVRGDPERAGAYLEAAEDHGSPQWNYLMGERYFRQERYADAAGHYHRAEQTMGQACRERLEVCYRELEDYKMAYYYAKQ